MADRDAASSAPAKAPPPVDPFQLLFVGTHGHVVAFQKFTGKEVWRTNLPKTGWSIATLLVEGGVLFAASKGHLFALDPLTGEIFWSNPMSGLGSGHACLATMRQGSDRDGNPLPQVAAIEDEARRHAAT